MTDTTYVVRRGSPVWVCKGELPYTDKPYKFIPHKMKRDLTFPYPRVPGEDGPGVIAIAGMLPLIIDHKQQAFSECFVEAKSFSELNAQDKPVRFSFLNLLEKGMSLFATGNDEYPVIAVFEQYVDEVKEDRWHREDLGDGLSRHTIRPKFQTEYPMRMGRRS